MKNRSKLVGLMLCQLFAYGAFNPVLSVYLKEYLGFSGFQSGFIMSMAVVSSLFAPLLAVYVIDRRISSRRMLMLCHGVLILCSLALSQVKDFYAFLFLYLLLSVFSGPTVGLINSISFAQLSEEKGNFGRLRLWGTLGWIASGWLISFLWLLLPFLGVLPEGERWYPLVFLVASLGSLGTLIFARLLPRQTLDPSKPKVFIPPETLEVFKNPNIVILCFTYLFMSILDRFYFFGTGPYLLALGLDETWVLPVMTLGQISEVLVLMFLSNVLKALGYRRLLILGMSVQILRFLLYAAGSFFLAILGVSLNGFIFAWVYTAITMYIDAHTDGKTRTGVHQLLVFAFSGVSNLLGNLLAGLLNQIFSGDSKNLQGWQSFWLVPIILGTLVLGAFLVLFKREKSSNQMRTV